MELVNNFLKLKAQVQELVLVIQVGQVFYYYYSIGTQCTTPICTGGCGNGACKYFLLILKAQVQELVLVIQVGQVYYYYY